MEGKYDYHRYITGNGRLGSSKNTGNQRGVILVAESRYTQMLYQDPYNRTQIKKILTIIL